REGSPVRGGFPIYGVECGILGNFRFKHIGITRIIHHKAFPFDSFWIQRVKSKMAKVSQATIGVKVKGECYWEREILNVKSTENPNTFHKFPKSKPPGEFLGHFLTSQKNLVESKYYSRKPLPKSPCWWPIHDGNVDKA
ncbi:hypothetical protein Tsp_15307, partial [Trichinella spiralis]|uniref:hypothetical protein n=1 Tax=Trichinella spiralis TaxID=6334 RepID=UPI0001EFE64E